MAISITHTTEATGVDSADGKISKNAWNEAHTLEAADVIEALLAATTKAQAMLALLNQTGELFSPAHGNPAVGGPHLPGSHFNLAVGTTAAPDTQLATPLKVSRVLEIDDDDLVAIGAPALTTGDAYLAAIAGFCKGTEFTTVQPIGGFFSGINYGQTTSGVLAGTRPDAVGVFAQAYTAGPGGAIALYADAARVDADGYCSAIEAQSRNQTGVAIVYDPLVHHSNGIWLVPGGNADNGPAILLGHPFPEQWAVGFAIQGTVNGGKTGAVRDASFRDDGNALTVFDINGSHTNGLDLSGATFSGSAILLDDTHTIDWGGTEITREDFLAESARAHTPLHIAPTGGIAYIDQAFIYSTAAGGGTTADRWDMTPFIPERDFTIDRLYVNVTTAAAGANAKVTIYSSNAAGHPDAKLHETGNIDCSVLGMSFAAHPFTFLRGVLYWIGCRTSSAATSLGFHNLTVLRPIGFRYTATGGNITTIRRSLAFATPATDPFGAVGGAEWVASNAVAVYMRVA